MAMDKMAISDVVQAATTKAMRMVESKEAA